MTNYEELLKIKRSLRDFVRKVVCVDPLDRPICDDEEGSDGNMSDQGTKVADFVTMVRNLEPIDGKLLQNPLRQDVNYLIQELFK